MLRPRQWEEATNIPTFLISPSPLTLPLPLPPTRRRMATVMLLVAAAAAGARRRGRDGGRKPVVPAVQGMWAAATKAGFGRRRHYCRSVWRASTPLGRKSEFFFVLSFSCLLFFSSPLHSLTIFGRFLWQTNRKFSKTVLFFLSSCMVSHRNRGRSGCSSTPWYALMYWLKQIQGSFVFFRW